MLGKDSFDLRNAINNNFREPNLSGAFNRLFLSLAVTGKIGSVIPFHRVVKKAWGGGACSTDMKRSRTDGGQVVGTLEVTSKTGQHEPSSPVCPPASSSWPGPRGDAP